MEISMIPINEAQNIIQKYITQQTEFVELKNILHRTTAQVITSPEPIPPFNKSAMDGYACKMADISKPLACITTVNAGSKFEGEINEGQCVKIMTGAPVPHSADTVFMYEQSEVLENGFVVCTNPHTSKNICYLGEDISVGQVIIEKDTCIQAQHIAILASLGIMSVEVYEQLKVGIIATGTELVESNETSLPWQIRNSNSPLFQNLVPYAQYYGIVADNNEQMTAIIQKAYSEVDVLLITGGASDSEFDLVPIIIQELGFLIEVRKVAMQPGKPFMFAHGSAGSPTAKKKICFGLSGNPVSAYVQFLQFVKSFLRLPQGLELKLPIQHDFTRKKAQRDLFVPVEISIDGVKTVSYNGSAHIAAYATAQALMLVPQGIHEFKKGDLVRVRQL